MAGAFTHFVICDQAKSKKKVLGVELWQLLNKYYQFLFLGAASPDLPYLSFKTGCVNWADVMHYETRSPAFLLRPCPVVPGDRPSRRKSQSP